MAEYPPTLIGEMPGSHKSPDTATADAAQQTILRPLADDQTQGRLRQGDNFRKQKLAIAWCQLVILQAALGLLRTIGGDRPGHGMAGFTRADKDGHRRLDLAQAEKAVEDSSGSHRPLTVQIPATIIADQQVRRLGTDAARCLVEPDIPRGIGIDQRCIPITEFLYRTGSSCGISKSLWARVIGTVPGRVVAHTVLAAVDLGGDHLVQTQAADCDAIGRHERLLQGPKQEFRQAPSLTSILVLWHAWATIFADNPEHANNH